MLSECANMSLPLLRASMVLLREEQVEAKHSI